MKRYFFHIAYNGSNYSGWQRQTNATTIQEEIEACLSKVLRTEVNIMGCGRTDAGVHAEKFYFHTDLAHIEQPIDLIHKMNRMTSKGISFYSMLEMPAKAHTRFDATERSYVYHLSTVKEPFGHYFSYYLSEVKLDKLNEAASILLEYDDFFTLSKSNTDVNNYRCDLKRSEWLKNSDHRYEFHISANRFLRGMVRLVVGMCLNYLEGKITLDEIHDSLKKKIRLPKDYSAPANGLFLNEIKYPYDVPS